MGTAVLGAILVLTIAFEDFGSLPATIPILAALAAQAAIGHKFRATRSQWAAWGLMATYLTAAVLHLLQTHLWSSIVIKVAIAFVYIRGFKASIDYEELDKLIRAPQVPTSDHVNMSSDG
jgi:hypothetical protein